MAFSTRASRSNSLIARARAARRVGEERTGLAMRVGGAGKPTERATRVPGRAVGKAGQPHSLTRDALQRLLHNKAAIVGMAVITGDVLLAIFAPVLAPYSPTQQDLLATYANPSRAHLLGTDALGREC